MKNSDLIIILLIYGVCGLFLGMALELNRAARIYPLALIAVLGMLNSLYLARCLLAAVTGGRKFHLANDLPAIFGGFLARQFFFVIFACLAYMLIMPYAGFYLSGLLYLLGVLAFFHVRPLYMALATGVMGALIYGVFDIFLKVPLPVGIIFS